MITVTDTGDSGAGTLRQAIADAAVGEEIQFAVTGNIDLQSELAIGKNLTITGPGLANLTVDRDGGAGDLRIFNITAGTVTISGLTIQGGSLSGADKGAGILIALNAVLTLNDCRIYGCSTASDGGGVYNTYDLTMNRCTIEASSASGSGGGLYNLTVARVNNCTFITNTCNANGGAIANAGTLSMASCTVGTAGNQNQGLGPGSVAGGLWTQNTATIVDTNFDYNQAAGAVAENVFNGTTLYMLRGRISRSQGPRPAFLNQDMAQLQDVTISNNLGVGLSNTGTAYLARVTIHSNSTVGIDNNNGTVYADTCTISGNSTTGIANTLGSIEVRHSTVTKNSNVGIRGYSGSFQTLENNIISGNTLSDLAVDDVDLMSLGHNIFGVLGGPITMAAGDFIVVGFANLGLGLLADNGGSTLTHAVLAGSPAIDAGNTAGGLPAGGWGAPDPRFQAYTAVPPVYDQRMAARVQGVAIDIGAVEFPQGTPIPPNVVYPPTEILEDGCQFCGLDAGKLKSVQLQLAANTLLKLSPTADVTLAAVLRRATASGICCLTRDQLRGVILQLAYQIRSSVNG